MKELKIKLKKTKDGYVVANESTSSIDIFDDTDYGRQQLVKLLVEQFINVEIEQGRKYI